MVFFSVLEPAIILFPNIVPMLRLERVYLYLLSNISQHKFLFVLFLCTVAVYLCSTLVRGITSTPCLHMLLAALPGLLALPLYEG